MRAIVDTVINPLVQCLLMAGSDIYQQQQKSREGLLLLVVCS